MISFGLRPTESDNSLMKSKTGRSTLNEVCAQSTLGFVSALNFDLGLTSSATFQVYYILYQEQAHLKNAASGSTQPVSGCLRASKEFLRIGVSKVS